MQMCQVFISDNWEVPFESITDLEWLGSGAQGAVFLGKVCNEEVAVKKVHNMKDTDIKNLRKLNHPNIISFRYFIQLFYFLLCNDDTF